MQITKLTNPLYIGVIAPLIRDFYDRVLKESAKKAITYETLYGHLVNVVQVMGNVAEVWVGVKENIPIAFSCWNVLGFPYFGAVYCSVLYSRDKEATGELMKQFVEFAKQKKAPYVIFETQNQATERLFKKAAKDLQIELEPTNITQWVGRY